MLHRTLQAAGNRAAALERLRELEQLRLDHGWAGLPTISAALLLEAGQAERADQDDYAADLVAWAVRLSPREPGVYWGAGWTSVVGWRWLTGARWLVAWPRELLRSPPELRRLSYNGLLLAGPTMLLAVLAFLAISGLRHRSLLGHELGHLLPGATARQQQVLAMLALGMALLLPLGCWGLLCCWSLLLAPFLGWRERVVPLLGLLLLLFAPQVTMQMEEALNWPNSLRAAVFRLQHATPRPDDVQRVETALQAKPKEPLLHFSLALAQKRAGDLEGATLRLAAWEPDLKRQREAALLTGILHLAQNRVGEGRQLLNDFVTRWPQSAAGHFNLYRVAQVTAGEDRSGSSHLLQAQQLDDPGVEQVLTDNYPGLNRFLMDEAMPAEQILTATHLDPPPRALILTAAAPWLWGHLPVEHASWLGAGSLVALLLIWLLADRLRWTHACVTCGRALCPRCHTLVGRTEHCEACTPGLLLAEDDFLVSGAQLAQTQRTALAKHERLALFSSFLLPGAGQLLQGRVTRGLLLLVLWSGVVIRWVLAPWFVPDRLMWGPSSPQLLLVLLGLAWLSLLGLAALDVRHHIEQESVP